MKMLDCANSGIPVDKISRNDPEYDDTHDHVAHFLAQLSIWEADVIRRLFWHKQPLNTIAEDYHISRDRVRFIREAALRKLRVLMGAENQVATG